MFRSVRAAIYVLALTLGISVSAFAQVPTGTISGTVVDKQGLAINDAQVTVISQETGVKYTSKTSSNGGYEVTRLDFGVYTVEVSKDGFKTASVTEIKLDASTEHSVPPITMEVGAISETVTVEGGAGQVQTTNAEITTVVDKQQLEDLPILDRNPLNLLALEPGVNQNGRTNTVVNGQRSSFTSMTLDGINIQDNFIRANDLDFVPNLLFLSQTSEFTLNSQNGDPSQGGGASAISIVTPRGTNDWHGNAFWYYRSNKWAANDWFNNASGISNFGLNQNQGGANIGGPILKNKLWVYGYYEFLSLGQTTPIDSTILTPSARNGTFQYKTSCNNTTIACPSGVTPGQLISVNVLSLENSSRGGASPVFKIDPAIASLLTSVPTAGNNTRRGDTFNTTGFQFNSRDDNKLKNTGIRFDYDASAHHSFSGTYQWNRQVVDRPDIDASFDTVPIVNNDDATNFASMAWRWSPRTNLTNEVRFGFDFAPATFNTSQQFGPTIVTGTNFTNPLPNFFSQGRNTRTWSWQDNATYVKANHTIIAGFQVQRITVNPFNFGGTSEDLALGFSTSDPFGLKNSDFPAPISANILANANGLLSSLGGFVGTTSETFNVTSPTSGFVPGAATVQNFRTDDWSLYAGDSWRIRRNLTVSYGLRWEYVSPIAERDGLILLPVVPAGQTVQQTLLSNASIDFVGGTNNRLAYKKDLKDFAPNFGVAWDPRGDGKMAIRGGYSIHYVNDDIVSAVSNAVNGNAGLVSSPTNNNVFATISGDNGAPGPATLAAPPFGIPTTFQTNFNNLGGPAKNAGFAISPNLRTPYVQEWNLSVQKEIGWRTTLTVSYVGNHGTGLIRGLDINQVNINSNGFLADFNRARNNCFLSIAANGTCNINFAGPGSQPLQVFPKLPGGGLPGNSTVQTDIEQGVVGTLADLYHDNGIESFPGQFTPNELIEGGDLLENFSSSTYHAGVVELRRRFQNGLFFQASYVFSKVLDDADGSQNNFQPLIDNANPANERGRASFDLTHALKANFAYELPFGKGHALSPGNRILNRAVSGWKASSIFTLQSGAPFSVVSGRGTVNRAARSGGETVDTSLTAAQIRSAIQTSFPGTGAFAGEVLLINPSFIDPNTGLGAGTDGLTCSPLVSNGFCNPQPGQLGNLARNAFNGPNFFDMDFSVLKTIPITERMSVELRGDAFNILNHPVFLIGTQNINSTVFGQITSTASTPRIVQIGAKFSF